MPRYYYVYTHVHKEKQCQYWEKKTDWHKIP